MVLNQKRQGLFVLQWVAVANLIHCEITVFSLMLPLLRLGYKSVQKPHPFYRITNMWCSAPLHPCQSQCLIWLWLSLAYQFYLLRIICTYYLPIITYYLYLLLHIIFTYNYLLTVPVIIYYIYLWLPIIITYYYLLTLPTITYYIYLLS